VAADIGEDLGCPDRVDIYGMTPHFERGSSFFQGLALHFEKEIPGGRSSRLNEEKKTSMEEVRKECIM